MQENFRALERQRAIYVAGISGQKPKVPVNPEGLATAAKRHMSKEAFAYIAGGAGLGETIERNRSAFEHWQIVPRMLRDVSQADTSIEILGLQLPVPIFCAPVGVLEMVHQEADKAVGKAAAKLGIPYIFSNQASMTMEEVAKVMGSSPRWFQLYWSKSQDLVASFVHRAEACGCSAIVVTLDTTMLGWRVPDLDLAYLPFLRGKGIAQYSSDPVFQRLMVEEAPQGPAPKRRISLETIANVISLMRTYPGGFLQNLRSGRALAAVRKFIEIYTNPALNWGDLSFLREQTKLPIILKGILHPEDAHRALDAGVDGLIISNHGGRQVDGAVSTIEMLPQIASLVDGKVPLILDSGVRTGADMFKAIHLGASAIGIGRPYAYGLAIAGEQGVSEVLQNLWADFELTMRLSGCRSLADIRDAEVLKTN